MGQSKPIRMKHSTAPQTPSPHPASDKDMAVTALIRGLNLLAAHAREHNLGNAARILSTAKEDMVYWAVDMNFHETAKDRFLNTHLFAGDHRLASEMLLCLSGLDDGEQRDRLVAEFNALITRASQHAASSYTKLESRY